MTYSELMSLCPLRIQAKPAFGTEWKVVILPASGNLFIEYGPFPNSTVAGLQAKAVREALTRKDLDWLGLAP